MALLKASLLFRYTAEQAGTGGLPRTAGWSESIILPLTALDVAVTRMREIAAARTDLLGDLASIIGFRFQQVDPVRRANSRGANFPGKGGQTSDIAQMSMFTYLGGVSVNNASRLTLRGIPDDRVANGSLRMVGPFRTATTAYLRILNNTYFRGLDLTQAAYGVFNIDALGNYSLNVDAPYNVGAIVRIRTARSADGRRRGGQFRIETKVDARNGKLQNWPYGATIGGKMTQDVYIYHVLSTAGITPDDFRVTTRRTGRPFGVQAGASRRRPR